MGQNPSRIGKGILEGDLDCGGHTLFNINLSGLGLTKASVGLGNVDNTSDLDKPISTATQAALNLKENLIPFGTTSQFWRGDKVWTNYGTFIYQNNTTTFSLITVRGDSASQAATFRANRNDSTVIGVALGQFGAAMVGNALFGLPAANVGQLAFDGCSYGVIRTNNAAPIVFGVNGTQRMRLTQGLNVGGNTDPGAGCITAFGTITGGTLVGGTINGTTFSQITTPHIAINGIGGQGYIAFASQNVDPPTGLGAMIFSNVGGRIAIIGGLNPSNNLSFDTDLLTADRVWGVINASGAIPVIIGGPPGAPPGTPGPAGRLAYDNTGSGTLYVCVATDVWRKVNLSVY